MIRLLALVVCLAPLAATAQPLTERGTKNPGTAQVLSIVVPGGGQIYAGETLKGGLLFAGSAVGLAVAANELPKLAEDVPDRAYYTEHGTRFGVGLGVAGVLWVYGMLDAPGAARRANARRGLAAVEVAPAVVMANGRHRAGLSLRASF